MKFENLDLGRLELNLINSMKALRQRVVENYGVIPFLENKSIDEIGGKRVDFANSALTQIDLDIQERVLQGLYDEFPDVEISVEERTADPSETQSKLYENDGKSEVLVQLDSLDGTYGYKNGNGEFYGTIGSVVRRTSKDRGEFVSVAMYFPHRDFFYVANKEGVHRLENDRKVRVHNPRVQDGKYSAAVNHDSKVIGIDESEYLRDIYAITQAFHDLAIGKMPGFLTKNRHIYDHVAVPWAAQRLGADVAYASGEEFGEIRFGDSVNEKGIRETPMDTKGLLVVGDRGHMAFQRYLELSYYL